MRVTERDAVARPDARETQSAMAGALLRVARESAGMSIDAVASNLKLAPRQVKALEDGDYTRLPGRTFIRGFVRNYARLVHLDPERVLSALPAAAAAPALEAPTLQPTTQTMGELPTTDHGKTSWARWAIPGVLAAIVAVAAVYEWLRPAGESHFAAQKEASAPAAASMPPDEPSTPAPSGATATPLPNPLASDAPAADAARAPVAEASSTTAPAAPVASPSAPAAEGTTPARAAAPAAGEQVVAITFGKPSWAEIRDRDGRVLLTGTQPGGTTQTVSGAAPLSINIGNANGVTLRHNGEPVDLAPYTQRNVVRLTLR
jgi:cytoskeleton protein RodZ